MHGSAVDAQTGHVFTGNGLDRSVSEVDPLALKVVRSVDVDGSVDAIAYDASLHRIYADEDDGTRIFVIDTTTFKQIAVVPLPGHKPEYLAIDPQSHVVYQNIASDGEYVVIDPNTLHVVQTVKTPGIVNNHPLQFDPGLHEVVIGGNGVIEGFDQGGKMQWRGTFPDRVDQCDLDPTEHRLACAGNGAVTLLQLSATQAPQLLGSVTRGLGGLDFAARRPGARVHVYALAHGRCKAIEI